MRTEEREMLEPLSQFSSTTLLPIKKLKYSGTMERHPFAAVVLKDIGIYEQVFNII